MRQDFSHQQTNSAPRNDCIANSVDGLISVLAHLSEVANGTEGIANRLDGGPSQSGKVLEGPNKPEKVPNGLLETLMDIETKMRAQISRMVDANTRSHEVLG